MGGRDLSELAPKVAARSAAASVGELVALVDDGRVPLVRLADPLGAAVLRARTTVDLYGAHVGAEVVLLFEGGDPLQPIISGVLRSRSNDDATTAPVLIETDGSQRLLVNAKEQLVLRCGKACITLTAAGKVLIEGSYLLSRSAGVNCIKGGSVQLN
jgi:hypothetical protein